ncbi:MAG TPA: hypothetical protein VLJ17_14825 [Xanthobacteraceae bacterium]|nr:hypothetical protein [Xanthobacteraceae bacterium]
MEILLCLLLRFVLVPIGATTAALVVVAFVVVGHWHSLSTPGGGNWRLDLRGLDRRHRWPHGGLGVADTGMAHPMVIALACPVSFGYAAR